jgi:hypothetical protein
MKCDFSATTQEEGMLDSMVRWYQKRHIWLLGIDAPEGWGYQ